MEFFPISCKKSYSRPARSFLRYHNNHQEIWDLFVHFAYVALQKGSVVVEADLVMEQVRWTIEVEEQEHWDMPGEYLLYYARLFNHKYRELTNRSFLIRRVAS